MERLTGSIYVVTHVESGRRYVGQTIHPVAYRWKHHVAGALNGRSHCRYLASAIRKHGTEAFTVETVQLIEAASKDELATRLDAAEIEWIARLASLAPSGFNLAVGGQGKGRGHTEETRRRLSELQLGRKRGPMSSEHRAKLRARPISDETRARQSAAATGRKWDPEHIARRAEARRGFHHSDETRARQSAALKGRTYPRERVERALATRAANHARRVQLRRDAAITLFVSRSSGIPIPDLLDP